MSVSCIQAYTDKRERGRDERGHACLCVLDSRTLGPEPPPPKVGIHQHAQPCTHACVCTQAASVISTYPCSLYTYVCACKSPSVDTYILTFTASSHKMCLHARAPMPTSPAKVPTTTVRPSDSCLRRRSVRRRGQASTRASHRKTAVVTARRIRVEVASSCVFLFGGDDDMSRYAWTDDWMLEGPCVWNSTHQEQPCVGDEDDTKGEHVRKRPGVSIFTRGWIRVIQLCH